MQIMSKFGLFSEFPGALPEAGESALQAQAAALTAVCDRWDTQQQAILADAQLTPVAKREKLAALTTAETAAVERALNGSFHSLTRAALQAELEQTRAALALRFNSPLATTDAERMLARMDESRILDRLRAMAPGERYVALREAAKANDLATLRAVRQTRLVPPEQWANVDRLHLEQHYAERTDALRRLEKLAEVFDMNADIARRTVRGQGRRRPGVAR